MKSAECSRVAVITQVARLSASRRTFITSYAGLATLSVSYALSTRLLGVELSLQSTFNFNAGANQPNFRLRATVDTLSADAANTRVN